MSVCAVEGLGLKAPQVWFLCPMCPSSGGAHLSTYLSICPPKEQDSEQTTPKRKFSMKAVQDWLGSSFKKEEKPPPPPEPQTVEAMATAMDVGMSAGRPDVYENIGTNLEAPKVPLQTRHRTNMATKRLRSTPLSWHWHQSGPRPYEPTDWLWEWQ